MKKIIIIAAVLLAVGINQAEAKKLSADINKDGKVDIYDYSILVSEYKKTGCHLSADLNGDCVVNQKDYKILLKQFTR